MALGLESIWNQRPDASYYGFSRCWSTDDVGDNATYVRCMVAKRTESGTMGRWGPADEQLLRQLLAPPAEPERRESDEDDNRRRALAEERAEHADATSRAGRQGPGRTYRQAR